MTPAPLRWPDAQLARARQRITLVSLILGLGFVVQQLSGLGWYRLGGRALTGRYEQGELFSALLLLALAGASGWRWLSDAAVFRLGRVVVVLACFASAMLMAFSRSDLAPINTYAPLLIVVFALLVPASPRQTRAFVLAATVAVPLGVALGAHLGSAIRVTDLVAATYPPLLAALIGAIGADLMVRTTIDIATLGNEVERLDALVGALSDAMVLRDAQGDVVFANPAARALLGPSLDAPPPFLAEAIAANAQGTVVGQLAGRHESYQLVRRRLGDDPRGLTLLVLRRLTVELDQAEVASWRTLLRALSHELGNTLAPMSSYLHSLRTLVSRHVDDPKIAQGFDGLEGRVTRLKEFLSEYATLARLPSPRPREVDWSAFLASLDPLAPPRLVGPLPSRPGVFDPGQLEQVLLNLHRNAVEAGSPPADITLQISEHAGGFALDLSDRGQGLSAEAEARALSPFYSTKADGTGLGLALCREIVVAHGGWLSLANRLDGGAIVRVWLPLAPPASAGSPDT